VNRYATTLATIWRLAAPYFWSEDRWRGRALLFSVIAIELAIVAITVLINQWNARFYNALQDRNWATFLSELAFFSWLAAAYIVLAVYQLYLNQWLQIRWRNWMTRQYLGRWLDQGNHYRMQLLGDAADNPDQRIAEDIQMFIERTLTIGIGLLSAIVTVGSFIAILWGLSQDAPLHLFGSAWPIPGYLVWAALIYSVAGTLITHLIGRPLIWLMFNQQRFEADFRFNLVRVRENSEQIALLGGEVAERERLMDRFAYVVANWLKIMTRTKKLTFFTASFNQVSTIFPFVVVAPAYFAGAMQLGGLTQTASAFGSVQQSLSFFITVYRQLAEWRAVVARLDGFDATVAAGWRAAATPPVVSVAKRPDGNEVDIDALEVNLPAGTPLVEAHDLVIKGGDRALVTGPTGSGKSTLFRAIAGVWPFGSGTVTVPEGARIMLLPQRPYLPVGTLEAAVNYPAAPSTFARARVLEVLNAVGLPNLVERLDEEAHWNRILSLGEQQRIGIARAILEGPDYLFLDEATASLDESAEAALYRMIEDQLPRTTVVSIGHRSTLYPFHRRRLTLVPSNGRHRVEEAALEAAE
jgi:vitamin B12/bleomycin/antimicrobial peptide transport system ATP-binding/permease protein